MEILRKLPGFIRFSGRQMAMILAILALTMICPQSILAASKWSLTGSMNNGRDSHTATLLPNGKVLVAGGIGAFIGDSSRLISAELYNPDTGSWTNTGSLSQARFLHTATLLPNGQVLVAGGEPSLASAELYSPDTGSWSPAKPLIQGRMCHTATLLPNGKVLVAGGYDDYYLSGSYEIATAELYDPVTGDWSPTGLLSQARAYHTATLLPNGKVLVVGGQGVGGNLLASAELYDPDTGSWTNTGSMSHIRYAHTATLLPNGQVLVAGCDDTGPVADVGAELYNPITGMWTNTGSLLSSLKWGHTATLLSNGKVLVAFATDGAELYDPARGAWGITDSLIQGHEWHTATLLPNGKVLVAGGVPQITSADLYSPSSDITPIHYLLLGD